MPLIWGIFSRCFGEYSIDEIQIEMAPLEIVALDPIANIKTPPDLKEKGMFCVGDQVTNESANTSLSKTRLRFLVLAGDQTISIPSLSLLASGGNPERIDSAVLSLQCRCSYW